MKVTYYPFSRFLRRYWRQHDPPAEFAQTSYFFGLETLSGKKATRYFP
jgi:hypothetical protein